LGKLNKKLRDLYERATLPIGKALSKLGLTPNMLTAISFFLGLIPIYFAYMGKLLFSLIFFIITVFFDVFDGSLARATGKASRFGKVLDHTIDRYVEFSYIIALLVGGYINGLIAVLAVTGIIMPSYVRGKGESVCDSEAAGVGLFERKEKIATLVIGTILYILYGNLRWFNLSILEVFVLVTAIASHFTAIQRLMFFKNNC